MSLEDLLSTAAANGDAPLVEELLRTGAQVNGTNRFGRTAIQVMMMGSEAVARVLLSHGANPNVADPSTGTTPLHDAARAGYLGTVRLLVRYEASPQALDRWRLRPVDLADDALVVDFLKSL